MYNPALGMPSLPTEDDLPCDDGEPMETWRHRLQMELLIHSLDPWARRRGDCVVGGNMFLYFSSEQLRGKDFRGPDFFVALGVSTRERKSWVVWEEGKGPDLIIELLSESTIHTDKTEKRRIYQDQLRVAEYFWFDPWHPEDFAGFTLTDGRYWPILPSAPGRIPSPLLDLELCWWDGTYGGVEARWIRWATRDGEWLPTDAEDAKAQAVIAEAQAAAAVAQAEAAEGKATAAEAEAERARSAAERAQSEATALARRLTAESDRAAAAESRAREAEAELARLRALLEQPRP